MRLARAVAATALIAFATPASAQVVDLSQLKCEEFLKSGKDGIAYIVMWLDGFYSDSDATPAVDFGKVATKIQKFGDYCGKNPAKDIIAAADEILGK
jgi:acid stress chaperone HdeB